MRYGHCAHCGTNIFSSFDLAKFGTITLHSRCVEDYRAENPGFNHPARVSAPAPVRSTFLDLFGQQCACCHRGVDSYELAHVEGHSVHAACVTDFRVELQRQREAQAMAAAGVAGAVLLVEGLSALFKKW